VEAASDLIFRVVAVGFLWWLCAPQWSFTPVHVFMNVLFLVSAPIVLFGSGEDD